KRTVSGTTIRFSDPVTSPPLSGAPACFPFALPIVYVLSRAESGRFPPEIHATPVPGSGRGDHIQRRHRIPRAGLRAAMARSHTVPRGWHAAGINVRQRGSRPGGNHRILVWNTADLPMHYSASVPLEGDRRVKRARATSVLSSP